MSDELDPKVEAGLKQMWGRYGDMVNSLVTNIMLHGRGLPGHRRFAGGILACPPGMERESLRILLTAALVLLAEEREKV